MALEGGERVANGNRKKVVADANASGERGEEKLVENLSVGPTGEVLGLPWSQTLQSPVGVDNFSPSLEVAKPNSLHGLGLRLAKEKSTSIGQVAHRLLLLLTEFTNTYETVGLSSLKCAQLLQPRQLPFPASLEEQALALHSTLASFSMTTRQLAALYRIKIANPLEESLTTNGVIVRNSNQRYLLVRQQSRQARQSVISSRKAYARAVKNAGSAFRAWKEARATTPMLTNDNDAEENASDLHGWEKALPRLGSNVPGNTAHLVQLLKAVQDCEKKYRERVATENKAVDEAQEVEGLGLNEIQSVVLGRLEFFLDPLAYTICNYDNDAIASTPVPSVDDSTATSSLEKRNEGGLFSGLFKQQNFKYEEGTGIMEAEMRGLPEEAGRLRDEIQSTFVARSDRIKASQAVKTVLDDLIMVNSKLVGSFKVKAHTGKSSSAQTGTLHGLARDSLGSNSEALFRSIMQVFDSEAASALKFVESMNGLSMKLDPFLDRAGLDLQTSIAADATEWKKLGDASRLESRAQTKYNQIKLQREKARERASSADASSITSLSDDGSPRREDNGAEENDLTNTPSSSRMGKFGSMLAGTEAIKKLQNNALNTISKMTLKDERVAKEKQAFDDATKARSNATDGYISRTKKRIQKLQSEDAQGWDNLKSLIESVVKSVDELCAARPEARSESLSQVKKISFDTLLGDVEAWVQSSKKAIAEAEEEMIFAALNKDPDIDTGYSMSVVLENSDSVYKLLELRGDEDEVPELGIVQVVISQNKIEEVGSLGLMQDQALDSNSSAGRDEEEQDLDDENQKSLQRSLSTPAKSDDNDLGEDSKKHSISFDDAQTEDEAAKEEALRQTFIKNFWSDRDDKPPTILQTISCSYRTKEKGSFLVPQIHGRSFTTSEELYFLAWDGKSFILPWTDIVRVDIEKGLLGGNETSIGVTYLSQAGAEYTFILGRLEARDSTLLHFRELLQESRNKADPENSDPSPVPPDTTLSKMEVVLSRLIRNVPISTVYEKVWSEGNRTSEDPFYGPWLEKEGCFDRTVEDWVFADDSGNFVNQWDKESYSQRRSVTFKFRRTTHLYMGSPIAVVKQDQFCRVEGADKCVVAIRVTFDGIPYADTFAVEVRWVATRKGKKDVKIQVGLFVDMLKTSMLTSKIKAGAVTETKSIHNRLFEAVRVACSVPGEDLESDPEDEADDLNTSDAPMSDKKGGNGIVAVLIKMFQSLSFGTKIVLVAACPGILYLLLKFSPLGKRNNPSISPGDLEELIRQINEMRGEMKELQKSVDAIKTSMRENGL